MIPPTYLDELSLLQDQIAPFSTEDAITMIEEELGLPLDELFTEISQEPVAAASLGQVCIQLCLHMLMVVHCLVASFMLHFLFFYFCLGPKNKLGVLKCWDPTLFNIRSIKQGFGIRVRLLL